MTPHHKNGNGATGWQAAPNMEKVAPDQGDINLDSQASNQCLQTQHGGSDGPAIN